MRRQDEDIFLSAAKEFNCWVLVRRTNVHSLKYIGQAGYTPKRIDCKAKTADKDVNGYKLAGLVVSPEIHPDAFKSGKASSWKGVNSERGYSLDKNEKSKHYGCLMLNGNYIHGDYDLYAVVDMKQPSRKLGPVGELEGEFHIASHMLKKIQTYVNLRIGSPVVQHGEEEMIGTPADQPVYCFGPHGENFIMLRIFGLRHMYEQLFQGRKL